MTWACTPSARAQQTTWSNEAEVRACIAAGPHTVGALECRVLPSCYGYASIGT
jgi:hypothetical protein